MKDTIQDELLSKMSDIDKSKISSCIGYANVFGDYKRENWHEYLKGVYDGNTPQVVTERVDHIFNKLDEDKQFMANLIESFRTFPYDMMIDAKKLEKSYD